MDHDTALEQSIKYFNGDKLAASIFVDKYALANSSGDILEGTPEAMHRRLAKEFARIEKKYPNPMSEKEIFGYFDHFKYIIPQGSPMSGIGNTYKLQSLSNCFVVETGDSYGAICKADEELAQVFKRRGGCGIDVSPIRPKGMKTSNAAGTTDGIGVFMQRFSNTCREVAQNGRRGAEMQTISVHHPEIRTFINIKRDLTKVTGANLSIRVSDEFMNAVKSNTDFELRWPVDSKTPKVSEMTSARILWEEIIESATVCAEPGLLFWDNILRNSPADSYSHKGFATSSTNPCSELPLSVGDACRLLVVNLMGFVENPFTSKATFNWKLFEKMAKKAQRLLDDLVDLELEHIDAILAKIESDPEDMIVKSREINLWKMIREKCESGRRTGLGPTAVGDMLASLGIIYGTQESVEFVEKVFKSLCLSSYEASIDLAEERGAFPIFSLEDEKNNEFLNRVWKASPDLYEKYKKHGRRNIANLTVAPVGSVSNMALLVDGVYQTTSGIESCFATSYTRRKKINSENMTGAKVDFIDDSGDKWQEYKVFHPGFKLWMNLNDKSDGDLSESPYHKATAMDLDWKMGVKLQAAAQQWNDHAISRTQNLPAETPTSIVEQIYMTAWESGCKGFTIYRDGSRAGVLITEPKETTKQERSSIISSADSSFSDRHAPKRPIQLPCDIITTTVKGEKWTFFVGLHEDRPYEIMGGLSKYISIPKRIKEGKIVIHNGELNPIPRYDLHYDFEKSLEDETVVKDIAAVFDNATNAAFTRTISLALRHGTPVQFVVEQLLKGSEKEDDLFSFSRAVSRVLKSYIKDGTKTSAVKVCPTCGSPDLAYQEGCLSCKACGFSKCN